MRHLILITLIAFSSCNMAYSVLHTVEVSAAKDCGICDDIYVELTKLDDMYSVKITLPATDGEMRLGEVHLLIVRQEGPESNDSAELFVPLQEPIVPVQYDPDKERFEVSEDAKPHTLTFRVSPAMLKRTFVCADYGIVFVGRRYKIDLASFQEELLNSNKHNQKLDPTVKTPVDSGNEQGTAGQL